MYAVRPLAKNVFAIVCPMPIDKSGYSRVYGNVTRLNEKFNVGG